MNRENYVILLATSGVPLEEADPPLEEGFETRLYWQCIDMLKKAKEEGRSIEIYTPND